MSNLASRFGVQSYSPKADLDYESWAKDGILLCEMHDLMPFAIGDWLNFGEQAYGQKYSQALSMTGLEYGTLVKYLMVSKAFPEGRRRSSSEHYRISWSHYRMLLGKPEEDQDKWLDAWYEWTRPTCGVFQDTVLPDGPDTRARRGSYAEGRGCIR